MNKLFLVLGSAAVAVAQPVWNFGPAPPAGAAPAVDPCAPTGGAAPPPPQPAQPVVQAKNPCTTVGPQSTVTTTPAPVATTVTTTPVVTCADFTCPKGLDSLGKSVVCAGGNCNEKVCCHLNPCTTAGPQSTVTTTPAPVATTVTTTPVVTCADFTCPKGLDSLGKSVVCAGGNCNAKVCCHLNPCTTAGPQSTVTTTPKPLATTVTTTPALTCASFTCPKGKTNLGKSVVCAGGKCNAGVCCHLNPCTTAGPQSTVTTTPPPPTCASFTCPAGSAPKNPAAVCTGGSCGAKQCCQVDPCAPVNAAPAPPAAPVAPAAPAAPVNPCTTGAPVRMYDAKEQAFLQKDVQNKKEQTSATPAWALPLLGMVTMFSLAAFFATRVRRASRSTRQVHIAEPLQQHSDNEALLSDDGGLE